MLNLAFLDQIYEKRQLLYEAAKDFRYFCVEYLVKRFFTSSVCLHAPENHSSETNIIEGLVKSYL